MTSKEYDKLSSHAKMIRAAELCGWSDIKTRWLALGSDEYPVECLCGRHKDFGDDPDEFFEIPDYSHDLNAMHEAEKLLIDDLDAWNAYIALLSKHNTTDQIYVINDVVHATAEARCRAFVLTMTGETDAD